ncbi:hypothetical protein GIB67_008220 [Kingdonia uniflora]|uniref:F-box domain-containing protein n=1 Tax=Kingdonia uniflora TaxID=39325 RepID=A0A7J7N4G0_9MAGN|nr:hypothetical protein GIB67_008220 [Kingdonia uniflora]
MGELRLDDDARLQSIPNWSFTTVLANASPEHQRTLLGDKLYPLVDHLEHDMAGKVTGMLLELDQPEVLHLLDSPKALKAKVSEAMEVLRNAASWLQSILLGGLVTQALSPPKHQRRMLGEKLYPLVDQLEHELACQVTGMLLEMDQFQVLQLLESREGLKAKVAEAMEMLNTSQTIPVVDLVTRFANTSCEHQKKMFGMSLNPLVDQLVNEMFAKLTGMLLKLDQLEVLHLLVSLEAFKAKVVEAVEGLMNDASRSQFIPIGTLATWLVNASPEHERMILGELLYPLVDKLEHESAPKVTGMLLEMDQPEIVHLLESPKALKAKVAEAMDVLKNVAQQQEPTFWVIEDNKTTWASHCFKDNVEQLPKSETITDTFCVMEEKKTSWESYCFKDNVEQLPKFETVTNTIDESVTETTMIYFDFVRLPDDLLERILAYLPVASVFIVRSVCKKWNEIVTSRRYLWNLSNLLEQKPWYFMFTSYRGPSGYAYDPVFGNWYDIFSVTPSYGKCLLPIIDSSNWSIASSYGLVCFMDKENGGSHLFVCNPITKAYKKLKEPATLKSSDYSALAISVQKTSSRYIVSIVKSVHDLDDFFQWDLSIQVYNSETRVWVTFEIDVLSGWRGDNESVICDGVLYFLIYDTGIGETGRGLVSYDLSKRSVRASFVETFINLPCPLTCARLMNHKDKLVMVGGICKRGRPSDTTAIGIWILKGKVWQQISRVPHNFFQKFGEVDNFFPSGGANDLIYIQTFGSSSLLTFDMNRSQWKWATRFPITNKSIDTFNGFCFEPRLEVSP